MCGIFGVVVGKTTNFQQSDLDGMLRSLFLRSELRGQEASGLAVALPKDINLIKHPRRAKHLLNTTEYKNFMASRKTAIYGPHGDVPLVPFACIGHSRLVTNGTETLADNNQPLVTKRVVGIHNGVIVNTEALWAKHSSLEQHFDVDSEIIFELLSRENGGQWAAALASVFTEIEGSASIACLVNDGRTLLLGTNTGSLYLAKSNDSDLVAFASERHTLEKSLSLKTNQVDRERDFTITRIQPGEGVMVDIAKVTATVFGLDDTSTFPDAVTAKIKSPDTIINLSSGIKSLRRCTRCVLPETFPLISFDEEGVCSVCRNHSWRINKGRDAFEAAVEKYRRSKGKQDSLIAFSGGRDSSYGLHYVVKELGMNPIAYTYDWGMVTDVARRNQARMVGKLGIEHIVRSPDIRAKRRHIRQNLKAWLARPDLGMIPLLSAGDKQFYRYGRNLRNETGVDLTFFCSGNQYERTEFKTGFCGISENAHDMRLNAYTIINKIKFLLYYAKQYALNYRYFNSSFLDIAGSFKDTYIDKDDFLYVFHYIDWNEDEAMKTLANEYGWEGDASTNTTWRIGDGFTPFHNYVYHTVAGFSEHDTYRSHQVRQEILTRDEALRLVEHDNTPRVSAMRDYAEKIGMNLEEIMIAVDAIPKLYEH